jgi:hypothetical protein
LTGSGSSRHAQKFNLLKSQYEKSSSKAKNQENGNIHMSDVDFFVSNPNTDAKDDRLMMNSNSNKRHKRSILGLPEDYEFENSKNQENAENGPNDENLSTNRGRLTPI